MANRGRRDVAMSKIEMYRGQLRQMDEWDSFLLTESGLPGPRGNLELAAAVAEEIDADRCWRYVALSADIAPTGTADEFLAFCGVYGLGKLLLLGDDRALAALRHAANDPRWRVREAVAMALQYLGRHDLHRVLPIVEQWTSGTLLEQRAAIAAICEPALLKQPVAQVAAVDAVDAVTRSLTGVADRKSEDFRVLRQGLAYCWSVAVASSPRIGKARMEAWIASDDRDVRWLLKENLKKNRLLRMDPDWVSSQTAKL